MDYDDAKAILARAMRPGGTYDMDEDEKAKAGAALAFLIVDIAQSLDAIATHLAKIA